jgi:hypothetical protein
VKSTLATDLSRSVTTFYMGATLIRDIALNGWTQAPRSDIRLTTDRGKMRLDLLGVHIQQKPSAVFQTGQQVVAETG